MVSDHLLYSLAIDFVQGCFHGDITIHVARLFGGQRWSTKDLQLPHIGNHLAWRSCLGESTKLQLRDYDCRLIELQQICILSSHIAMQRAMKAQGISRDSLPWRAPFQPYFSYISLCFTVVVCFFKGFDSFMPFNAAAFITHYIGFAIFGIGYFGYKCEFI
jgi:hypothetical protein